MSVNRQLYILHGRAGRVILKPEARSYAVKLPSHLPADDNDVTSEGVVVEQPDAADRFTYERDGLTLAYSVVGDGQQPIVFIPGATATGEVATGALAAAW